MKKKSVFILNNEVNECLEKLIRRRGFEIIRCFSDNFEKIPHDHNFYILHFSQTTEEAIIELRRKNPLAYIYLKSGCFDYRKRSRKRNRIIISSVPETRKAINDFGPGYYPVYTLFKNKRRD